MGARKRSREFDVSFSFAGENRKQVEPIVAALRVKGVSVFYDRDYRAHLWGKGQAVYDHIYGAGTKYVVPFVSEHYVRKDWPRREFEAARREARRRKHEFLLPVRLDDSPLLGLHEDVNYLDLREVSPEDVVQAILEKLGRASGSGGRRAPGKAARSQDKRIAVLTGRTRRALGIIASSILSLGIDAYDELFPQTNWSREVRRLKRKGLVTRKDGGLAASPTAKRALLNDTGEADELHEAWVNALRMVGRHVDTMLLLATHQIHLGRLDDAASTLAEGVECADLGHWNDTYARLLEILAERKVSRRLPVESRVRLHNALGICLSRAGRHQEAIDRFAKLRRLSEREGHTWGLGQSYINCGVACHMAGDGQAAARWYRKAVEHAKASGDDTLLGRSLSNLAQMLIEDQPEQAEALIKASIKAKKAADDEAGLVAAHGLLGNLAIKRRELVEATRWFRKAASEAKSLDLRHDRALYLHNLGSAYHDLGQHRRALRHYRQAVEIADDDGYLDALLLAGRGQARAEFEIGLFAEAETTFRRVHDLERDQGNVEEAMICLHGVGACLLKRNKLPEARKRLNAALRMARRVDSEEWIVRCTLDRARTAGKGSLGEGGIRELKRAARREARRGGHAVAARLWGQIADALRVAGEPAEQVEAALQHAEKCFGQTKDQYYPDKARLYANLYSVRWEAGDYDGGLGALAGMARAACEGGLVSEEFRAANQTGACLAELGHLEDAEASLRTARRLAKRLGDEACLQDAVANLGEILRRQGRHVEAIRLLEDAEAIASKQSDVEGEIGIAHNRALALQHRGDLDGAERLLRKCRDRARRRSIWREYVRALAGLANLSYMQGATITGRRYSHALAKAKGDAVRDLQAEIALNYAAWLSSQGKPKEALRLLRPYWADWSSRFDSHLFYRTLAQLQDEAGHPRSAVDAWNEAKEAAAHIGDAEARAFCSGALAEVYEELGENRLADAELQEALSDEKDPEGRALLLLQRTRLLLGQGKEKAVEKLYTEAKALIREHDLTEVDVDLHMALGDYEWKTPGGDRANGMKAYLLALLSSLELSEEAYGEAGVYIACQVIEAKGRLGEHELDQIEADVTEWLCEQTGATEQAVEVSLWPLRVGRKAWGAAGEKEPSEEALKRILAEEISSE